MPGQQAEPKGPCPLFSIIIPLEYHRGQWDRAWERWVSQSLDASAYEVILVVPPDFPARDALIARAIRPMRLEFSDRSHDIGLCAVGASKARGKYLFFTEAHCWPEPDVLALCARAFADHPGWAGFSCQSVRVTHNRLSIAEADMYEADIVFGMKVHPWRKVLDQCFVTRREAYEQCGGLRAELGHFAEWVLAAAYHVRGLEIGYLESARFHHYYIGELDELTTFTMDFVQGEIRYFGEGSRAPGSELMEMPEEWSCQDNFNAAMARGIIGMLAADRRDGQRMLRTAEGRRAIRRWIAPAVSGDGLARMTARVVALRERLVLAMAARIGSLDRIRPAMKSYIAALIRYQRLNCIHGIAAGDSAAEAVARLGPHVALQAGFYPLERSRGRAFRWSETEAVIRLRVHSGRCVVRLSCLPVREPWAHVGVRFYLDGARIPDHMVAIHDDGFDLRLDRPSAGIVVLGWICPAFDAPNDPRRLGLPVAGIETVSEVAAGAR